MTSFTYKRASNSFRWVPYYYSYSVFRGLKITARGHLPFFCLTSIICREESHCYCDGVFDRRSYEFTQDSRESLFLKRAIPNMPHGPLGEVRLFGRMLLDGTAIPFVLLYLVASFNFLQNSMCFAFYHFTAFSTQIRTINLFCYSVIDGILTTFHKAFTNNTSCGARKVENCAATSVVQSREKTRQINKDHFTIISILYVNFCKISSFPTGRLAALCIRETSLRRR